MGKKAKKKVADTRGFCTTSVAKKKEELVEEEKEEEEEDVPEEEPPPPEPINEEDEWEKAMAERESAEIARLEASIIAPRPNKAIYPCGSFAASTELQKIFEDCVAREEITFPKAFKFKSKLTFERLKTIYAEIEYHGFKHEQIARAMEATVGYDHRAALEYLLITEPGEKLPRTFQLESASVEVKELSAEEKQKQEEERLHQEEEKLKELEDKREAMRLAEACAKRARDEAAASRSQQEAGDRAWILNRVDDSSDESLADPHEVLEKERIADPTARLVKVEVRLRACEKRAKDLRAKKKQGAFKMNMEKEQKEQGELSTEIRDLRDEIILLRSPEGRRKYGQIASNVDDLIQEALATTKEPVVRAECKKDGEEEEEQVDVFEMEVAEKVDTAQVSLSFAPHSLELPKGWTGALPMKFFEDYIKKTYGKQATVTRNATNDGGWCGTLRVRAPNEFNYTAPYLTQTKGEAFHLVSTWALYEMESANASVSRVEKNLPGPYRVLYEGWLRSSNEAKIEERRANIRPRLALFDKLLGAQWMEFSQAEAESPQVESEDSDEEQSHQAMHPVSWPPKNRPLEKAREGLPVSEFRESVLRTIATSKVCIVSGSTGSGKTTQCPQFVLEHALNNGQEAMILVTEPRRISAISVATRVAEEMGSPLGTLVGYQIRMEKKYDPRKTRLLFCTTGVLIRKLRHDPKLLGVTHVFLDEIHERSAESDLCMLLLRRSLQHNACKVIAMSATLDTKSLISYFTPQTPHLEIPGRIFPVEELYVEDIIEATDYDLPDDSPYAKRSWWNDRVGANKSVVTTKGLGGKETTHVSYWDDDEYVVDKFDLCDAKFSGKTHEVVSKMDHTRINYELIDQCCDYIHTCFDIPPEEGCILIFLPGLMEIQKSYTSLSSHPVFGDPEKTRLISLHSVLSSSDQRLAFELPPVGIRKIVLSTNIAETGVTIPDVVFVIDTGKVKQTRYHEASNTASLKEMFVSQAEATQRRGRAGRVRSGFCFRLYTRVRFDNFPKFPVPELLRCALADLMLSVLCAKHQPSLFEEALDPPPKARIDQAVQLLRGVGAAEDDGAKIRVTSLGIAVAKLPVDVRIGKMLLYHHLFLSGHSRDEKRFKVLEGVPIAAAVLSHRSPFAQPFQDDKRAQAKKAQDVFLKRATENGGTSDHLAAVEAYFSFETLPKKNRDLWCKNAWVNSATLTQLGELKDDFTRHLAAFPPGPVVSSLPKYGQFVTSCIAAGLWPNVVRCDSDGMKSTITQGAESIRIHMSSLLHPTVAGPRWIAYYQKVRTQAIYLRDVTLMEPIWLLLFGSSDWELNLQEKCVTARNRDWQCVRLAPRTAAYLRQIRQRFDALLRSWLSKSRRNPEWSDGERAILRAYIKAMTA